MTIALPSPELLETPASEDIQFAVRATDTGDGFARYAPTGINNVKSSYSITWVLMLPDDSDAIRDALKSTGGVETITWTPPNETVSRNFVCLSVKSRYVSTVHKQVSTELKEKFV